MSNWGTIKIKEALVMLKEYNFIEINKGTNSKHRVFEHKDGRTFTLPYGKKSIDLSHFYKKQLIETLRSGT